MARVSSEQQMQDDIHREEHENALICTMQPMSRDSIKKAYNDAPPKRASKWFEL